MSISCSVKSLFSACLIPHRAIAKHICYLESINSENGCTQFCMILNVKCGDDIVVMQYRYLGQQL